MKKNIDMQICDKTRTRTYIATAKADGICRQKEFEMAYTNVSVFTDNLNRIVQQSIYFTVYDQLEDMK